MIRIGKFVAALLLLGSLALPVHSCTIQDPLPEGAAADTPPPTHVTYHYVLPLHRRITRWDFFGVAAFVWPLGAAIIAGRRRFRGQTVIFWLEPIPLLGTGYVIAMLGWIVGTPQSGAYVSTAGAILYALAWLMDAFGRLRSRWGRRFAAQR